MIQSSSLVVALRWGFSHCLWEGGRFCWRTFTPRTLIRRVLAFATGINPYFTTRTSMRMRSPISCTVTVCHDQNQNSSPHHALTVSILMLIQRGSQKKYWLAVPVIAGPAATLFIISDVMLKQLAYLGLMRPLKQSADEPFLRHNYCRSVVWNTAFSYHSWRTAMGDWVVPLSIFDSAATKIFHYWLRLACWIRICGFILVKSQAQSISAFIIPIV